MVKTIVRMDKVPFEARNELSTIIREHQSMLANKPIKNDRTEVVELYPDVIKTGSSYEIRGYRRIESYLKCGCTDACAFSLNEEYIPLKDIIINSDSG